MTKQALIPTSVSDRIPKPRSKWVHAAALAAAEMGVDLSGVVVPPSSKYTTISIPQKVLFLCAPLIGNGSVSRFFTAAAVWRLGAPDTADELTPMAEQPAPKPTTRTTFTPALTKAQEKWFANMEQRRRIIALDLAIGRWARFTIIGGSPAVDRFAPLDASGVRDFSDEIDAGIVVEELAPHLLDAEEINNWLRDKQSQGLPFTWAYVSGDSESLSDAQEARRRGLVRAAGGVALEQVNKAEREEKLQVLLYGRKTEYLRLMQEDVGEMRRLGYAVPPQMLTALKQARVVGWTQGEARPALTEK